MSHTYAKLTDYDTGNGFEVDLTFKVKPGQAAHRYRDNSWEAPVPPEVDLIRAEVLVFHSHTGVVVDRQWLNEHGFNLDRIALRVANDDLVEGDSIYQSLVEETLDETF
jgi:hypothetical protein